MNLINRGWSLAFLNSDGVLYSAGKLDGLRFKTKSSSRPEAVEFPAGYPPTTATRYEPATAIKQFSSGRRHILALSDSGKIWYWTDKKPALQVKFVHLRTIEGATSSETQGVVTKVVAGWEESSAYVSGTGIVFWNLFGDVVDLDGDVDTLLLDVTRTTIPNTGFRRPPANANMSSHDDHPIGEVLQYIVLAGFIVFITDLNKVFAVSMTAMHEAGETYTDDAPEAQVFELTTFHKEGRVLKDIQGSFEHFAVFGANGEVLSGDRSLLRAFWHNLTNHSDSLPEPKLVPALQNTNVISLAFGDYHYHALHSDGRISSYGTEPQSCGALGLGDMRINLFRGVRRHDNRDSSLIPHADQTPHYIWFEDEKRNWLNRLQQTPSPDTASPPVAPRWSHITDNPALQGEVSDWVEREGQAWRNIPEIKAADKDGLGPYFAFNVAAAGWHSAALVLVDEDLALQIREKGIYTAHLPEEWLS